MTAHSPQEVNKKYWSIWCSADEKGPRSSRHVVPSLDIDDRRASYPRVPLPPLPHRARFACFGRRSFSFLFILEKKFSFFALLALLSCALCEAQIVFFLLFFLGRLEEPTSRLRVAYYASRNTAYAHRAYTYSYARECPAILIRTPGSLVHKGTTPTVFPCVLSCALCKCSRSCGMSTARFCDLTGFAKA